MPETTPAECGGPMTVTVVTVNHRITVTRPDEAGDVYENAKVLTTNRHTVQVQAQDGSVHEYPLIEVVEVVAAGGTQNG